MESNRNGEHKVTSQRARKSIDWTPAFLSSLEETGVIAKAARSAEVSRTTVWERRQADPEFAKKFDEALRAGALLFEAEAIRRATEGVMRIKFNSKTGLPFIDPRTGGPYMEQEYSDALMIAILKRHLPDYREPKGDVHLTTHTNNFVVLSEDALNQLQARRAAALR